MNEYELEALARQLLKDPEMHFVMSLSVENDDIFRKKQMLFDARDRLHEEQHDARLRKDLLRVEEIQTELNRLDVENKALDADWDWVERLVKSS